MSLGRQSLLDEVHHSSSEQKSQSHSYVSSEVTDKDFIIGKAIGVGSTATVYVGEYHKQSVVIKHFDKPKPFPYPAPETIALFEFNTLKACFPSEYIVKPVAYSIKPPVVLLEYAERGTLLDVLTKEPLSWDQRIRIALDVALGLMDLKKIHYVHRDIKSDNILLTRALRAKLTDLDLSCDVNLFGQDEAGSLKTGTYAYLAPECLTYEYPFLPYAADVYSFGVLLIELSVSPATFDDYLNTDQAYHRQKLASYEIRTLADKNMHSSFSDDEPEPDMVEALVAKNRYLLLNAMIERADKGQWPRGYLALAKECIVLDPKDRPSIEAVAKRLDAMLRPTIEVREQALPSLKDKPHLWAKPLTPLLTPPPTVQADALHQTKCMPKCVIL